MRQATIGVRVHSGWGVAVAVSGRANSPEIVERKHILIVDPTAAGAKQPYHFAESLAVRDAEEHLSACAEASGRLALAAVSEMLLDLRGRNHGVTGCAMLLASGRTLPPLANILASHALIHTAEGEFFRHIFRDAFEELHVRVTGFRERELEERAGVLFGDEAARTLQRISELGRPVGPPWTKDEKTATLAAWMLLRGRILPSE